MMEAIEPEARTESHKDRSHPFIMDMWYVADRLRALPADGRLETTLCSLPLLLRRDKAGVHANLLDRPDISLPCRICDDLIWVFIPQDPRKIDIRQDIPRFGGPKARVRFMEKVIIPAHQDDAIYGLLDPAHTPFVHRSPLWRGNGILKEKTKRFHPTLLGFTMQPHAPVNSGIYKTIGGAITVRIDFRLPGLRAEYIENSRHTVLGLTALTPVDERHTVLRQIFYWNSPVLDVIRPFASLFARPFLQQDVDIMALRRINEPYSGKGMLLGDSDRQFLWYHQLRKAWGESGHCEKTFTNPLQPETLRWRT